MKTKTTSAVTAVFVLSCLASSAMARDWLHEPNSNAHTVPAPYATMSADRYVNYGTRAQVRIIRPDGAYLLGDDYYRYGTEGPGVVDREMKDD